MSSSLTDDSRSGSQALAVVSHGALTDRRAASLSHPGVAILSNLFMICVPVAANVLLRDKYESSSS